MSLDGGNPLRDFHYIFENITVPVYHHHSKSQYRLVQDVALSVQSAYPCRGRSSMEVMQGDFGSLVRERKETGEEIVNLQVKGQTFEGESFGGLYIRDTVFSDCRLLGCDVTRSSFIRVAFERCDLSNSDLSDSYFDGCRISDSKLVGTNLGSGTAKRLSVTNSNMSYTNWTGSKLLNLTAQDCDFQRAVFSECTLKSTTLKHDRFIGVDFFKTALKGVDLSACEIENLLVSDDHSELRGAIVNAFQAADFARLLGLIVT